MFVFFRHIVPLLLLASLPCLSETVVIGNPQIGISKLSADELRQIYLKKNSILPNGTMAIPFDQDETTAVHAVFYEKVVKMSNKDLRAYWSKQIFMEKGGRPASLANDSEVIAIVSQTQGAIGYVSKRPENRSIPVLAIIP